MAGRTGGRRGCDVVAALIGAPNSGKTTLFNTLTGRQEHVANWPGATVSLATGVIRVDGKRVCVVDLPGVYSISGDRLDERVARDFILEEKPDVVVVLVDPTSIERSLSLVLEVREIASRVVVAVTKADVLESKNIRIDVEKLSRLLRAPVVLVSAVEGRGVRELAEKIVEVARSPGYEPLVLSYGDLEPYIDRIASVLEGAGLGRVLARWYAVKLLEGDKWVRDRLSSLGSRGLEAVKIAEEALHEYSLKKNLSPIASIVGAKYSYASRIIDEALGAEKKELEVELGRLDYVFFHPVAGPILSLLILFGVFFAAFAVNIGFPLTTILYYAGLVELAETIESYTLSSLLDKAFSALGDAARSVIGDPVAASLVADGIIGGVGAVLTFLPLIVVVFFFMALLEDSGLLTRIAVSFDSFFSLFRLPGKTVFPVMVSMGCNVPGVMATRIIENDAQRRAAILSMPLIPCQARLYVVLALTSVFIESAVRQALVTSLIYLLSLVVFLFSARLFYALLGGEEGEETILEQVPLKKPSMKIVGWLVWDKAKHFLLRAGTIIFVMSVVVWFLTNTGPSGYVESPSDSFSAMIGRAMAPAVSAVFGLDFERAWRVGVGFLNGFVAKEVFVETLAMLSPSASSGGVSLEALRAYGLSFPQLAAILVAATLYVPCMATIAVMYRELESGKLALLGVLYSLGIATLLAWATYLVLSVL